MNHTKFIYITRTICPIKKIHYLDAIDENGIHWEAQMNHTTEEWLTYNEFWRKDPQQPKQ